MALLTTSKETTTTDQYPSAAEAWQSLVHWIGEWHAEDDATTTISDPDCADTTN